MWDVPLENNIKQNFATQSPEWRLCWCVGKKKSSILFQFSIFLLWLVQKQIGYDKKRLYKGFFFLLLPQMKLKNVKNTPVSLPGRRLDNVKMSP